MKNIDNRVWWVIGAVVVIGLIIWAITAMGTANQNQVPAGNTQATTTSTTVSTSSTPTN